MAQSKDVLPLISKLLLYKDKYKITLVQDLFSCTVILDGYRITGYGLENALELALMYIEEQELIKKREKVDNLNKRIDDTNTAIQHLKDVLLRLSVERDFLNGVEPSFILRKECVSSESASYTIKPVDRF